MSVVVRLWMHLYGTQQGLLGLFSGLRLEPGSKLLESVRTAFFPWPGQQEYARAWVERSVAAGRETYHCAHLLSAKRRVKENAAPLIALWVDGDGAEVPEHLPPPSAVVRSSPGRDQCYWRLTRAIAPEIGEQLNRRLACAMDADRSGWDLTQLLRCPGTLNFKYRDTPQVALQRVEDTSYDPMELDRVLPQVPGAIARAHPGSRPAEPYFAPDLRRLSRRMGELVLCGNRGEYRSRSEADFAVALGMFGAGYTETEVWSVMTDPANGISAKYFEKGQHGERYLALTLGRARAAAVAGQAARRRVVELRPARPSKETRRKVVITPV